MRMAAILDELHSVRDAWGSYKGKKGARKLEEIKSDKTMGIHLQSERSTLTIVIIEI